MIRLRWKDKWIDFESVEWSGTDKQCSRQLTFTIPFNPYDKDFKNQSISLGDLIFLYSDQTQLFVGTITNRTVSAEIGTSEYTAMDFMHHLLRSNVTYKFKGYTAEKVVSKVCKDLQIGVSGLAKTSVNIGTNIYSDKSAYDVIASVYYKASKTTHKKYMPIMDGKKLKVIEKGLASGVTLTQGINITSAEYTDTTDEIVDVVKIYDEKYKQLGVVKNQSHVEKFGVYQQTYTKESGVNAKNAAKSMLAGIAKTASIEALGDVKAVSGKSIVIKNKATGLVGTYYITSDTHTFSDSTHTMSLELSWKNEVESGADTEETKKSSKKSSGTKKAKITNASICYYLQNTSVYHSTQDCSACKGKKGFTKSTVAKVKEIKLKSGKNKGKRKYKACAKCWQD